MSKLFFHPLRVAAGLILMPLFFFPFINIENGGAQADAGNLSVKTDKLIYQPGEQAAFAISVDSGAQSLSGDLVIRVFPVAALSDAEAFNREPLSESLIDSDFSVSGQAAAQFEAAIDELEAGAGGFPVEVALVSEGAELITGTTWLAVADPAAHEPIDLVLLWTVGAPPERDPDQVFQSTALLERCRNVPRTTDTIIQHPELMLKYPRIKTTYALEGSLLEQLQDMSDGFSLQGEAGVQELAADSPEAMTATACLEGLRTLAAGENTEMLMSPFQFASLPVLAREGWDDGNGQYRIGRDIMNETLVLPAAPKGSYVPNLNLTTDSLHFVASTGGEYAVIGGAIRESVIGSFKPGEIIFRVRDMSGERITAVFADDDASGALLGPAPDANAFFAALANAYTSAGSRFMVAASPVSNPPLTAEERDRVYAQLEGLPWIQSLTLGEAKEKYRPDTEPVTLQRFIDPLAGYISEAYYNRLAGVHERFEDYRVAVDSDQPRLLRQVKNLYTAESEYFLAPDVVPGQANIGLAYLDRVAGFVEAELEGLSISVDTPAFQLAKNGEATVVIVNENPYAFNVDLVITGDGAQVEHEPQRLRVESGETSVTVPYEAAGWSGVSAELQSRGHRLAGDEAAIRPMTVRVWIVLIVTLAALAGGFLYYFLIMRRR